MSRIVRTALCILLLPAASLLRAQEMPSPKLDMAVTFIAERSLRSTTPDTFWMQVGSIELGTNAWHGLGVAANVRHAYQRRWCDYCSSVACDWRRLGRE